MDFTPESLLDGLNDEQKAAVTHKTGPLMIIAGAGTGKTTVITKRIGWLIASELAKPAEILALTFTDKAAGEMEERVDRLLPLGYLDLNISTFHSFCEKILREHGVHIGLSPDFTLYTEVDAYLLLRRSFDRFNLDYFKPKHAPTKFLKALLQHFSRLKDEGVTPGEYSDFTNASASDSARRDAPSGRLYDDSTDAGALNEAQYAELAHAYETYQAIMAEKCALDFGDLLLYAYRLLLERPNVLEEYRKRFKYIVVDEFQDTNSIQYKLVKLLVGGQRNITVVGDDDQAIYRFRGAALHNIMQFREDFPDATKIVLINNYRSRKEVLDAAYQLITQNNPHRLEVKEGLSKELKTNLAEPGFVHHLHAHDLNGEVEAFMTELARLFEAGVKWEEICVLTRANDSAEVFLEALATARVPYVFMAQAGLYYQPVILDSIAWLRIIVDPFNSPALYRLIAHPRLGLPESDVAAILHFTRIKGLPLIDALRQADSIPEVSPAGRKASAQILDQLAKLRDSASRRPVSELYVQVVKETGIISDLRLFDEAIQQETFRYLKEFLARIKKYVAQNPSESHVKAFLEEFDLERDGGSSGGVAVDPEIGPEAIKVMTVHAAKGLEFRYVFIVNCVEQRFPSTRRGETLPLPDGLVHRIAELDDHVAEERRLFYVALTRAKEGVFLLSADNYGGVRKRKVSRFVEELAGKVESRSYSTDGQLTVGTSTVESAPRAAQKIQTPKYFSFSQIAAFSSCPLQYKYAHILKIPTFGNKKFSFGQSIHASLEKFFKEIGRRQSEGVSPVVPSTEELNQIFASSFIDEWYDSPEDRADHIARGQTILESVRASTIQSTPDILGLEVAFTLKVKDITVKGKIDRIDRLPDGTVEIVDYKTGNPKEKLTWDDKRQLVLYALAGEQCFEPPLSVKQVTFHYLTDNTKVSFTPTQKDKDKLIDLIVETASSIEQSDFKATPDEFTCRYCDFKDICPFAKL